MRITFIQTDIAWEDKTANLEHYSRLLFNLKGKTDLVVLPEMCTTGFTMHPEQLAETDQGVTLNTFKCLSAECKLAIAGSHIGKEGDKYLNRGFFIQPDGNTATYDKRHLFRMGEEAKHYTAGNDKIIVSYLGWNIRLAICYDLRFPVWLRNVDNEYDLLLIVANWPESRQAVFDNLLVARALENQAFVCGVNRTGTDGEGLRYSGGSALINAYGKRLSEPTEKTTSIQTVDFHLEELHRFREKFPVWKDADRFNLIF
jgi:omega-amidase